MMMDSAHAYLPIEIDEGPLIRRDAKRQAVARLLEWGFDPSVISRMLGCSLQWIAQIDEERSSGEEHYEVFWGSDS
jgi:hypothetical protein